ncbi:hypothetical protein P7C70_g9304, partial [Phenoliferia sp. Uapishka_3]
MTAIASPIAIPFSLTKEADESHLSSPLSRSPFLAFSPSSHHSSFHAAHHTAKHALPLHHPSLPPTPPVHSLPLFTQPIQLAQPAHPYPTAATRPALIAPPPAPPPPEGIKIHSGSIIDTFKTVLEEINLDECEAHGENAVFVCDLAEVYRQAMRWQKELGSRVEAYFG